MNEYDQLWNLVSSRYGLIRRKDWKTDMQRATKQCRRSRRASLGELLLLASRDDAVLRELASYLTVDESYFFRHPEHFVALVDHLSRRLAEASADQHLNIWSAGCSDGQEPFSIAMTLKERLSESQCRRVSIIGTDISPRAIARAEEGVYSDWSFRVTDEGRRARFFTSRKSGQYELHQDIRSMARFHCLSVQEHARKLTPASLDCIFFRNVSIYLTPETQNEIYARFASLLKPGGLLFLAPSDTMPPRSLFGWRGSDSTSIYSATAEPISEKVTPAPRTRAARRTSVSQSSLGARPEGRDEDTGLHALRLADEGKLEAAVRAADDIVELQPYDKLGYLIRGQIYLAEDSFDEAINNFRRALFIAPEDSVIRYWYAFGLHRVGASRRSLIHVHKLESTLSGEQRGNLLEDGCTTAGELLNATRQLKELLE